MFLHNISGHRNIFPLFSNIMINILEIVINPYIDGPYGMDRMALQISISESPLGSDVESAEIKRVLAKNDPVPVTGIMAIIKTLWFKWVISKRFFLLVTHHHFADTDVATQNKDQQWIIHGYGKLTPFKLDTVSTIFPDTS